jgi:hypothetical protein
MEINNYGTTFPPTFPPFPFPLPCPTPPLFFMVRDTMGDARSYECIQVCTSKSSCARARACTCACEILALWRRSSSGCDAAAAAAAVVGVYVCAHARMCMYVCCVVCVSGHHHLTHLLSSCLLGLSPPQPLPSLLVLSLFCPCSLCCHSLLVISLFSPHSLLVLSLFSPCSLLVLSLFSPCSLLVLSSFFPCALLIISLFSACSLLVHVLTLFVSSPLSCLVCGLPGEIRLRTAHVGSQGR